MKNKKLLICVALSFLFGCQTNNMDYQLENPTTEPVDFSTPTPQPSRYNEYNIVLDIDPDNRIVRGIEKIKFTNNSNIPLLSVYINTYLNAFSNDCDYQPYFDSFKPKIFSRGVSYGNISVENISVNGSDVKFSHKNTILCFDLDSPLSSNATVEIIIGFVAKIPEINHRTGANDFAMWFGNFLPILAVHSDEGWQIDKYYAAGDPFYSRIANFHVVINTPAEYTVAGTGQKSSVTKETGKSTVLEAKLTRDFAFSISRDYKEEILVTENGVEITLYYYSELDNAADLLESAADSLSYYNTAIGSYPYSSLDIIECELFQKGGMKYPQVIFIDSEHLRERSAAETITRQVGYQWFYNVIGVNGVTEAWIFEGLTALLHDSFYFNDTTVNAKIRAEYTALANALQYADNLALNQNPDEYNSWVDYNNIVCMKSKMMFYSLKLKMGSKFNDFLSKFYSAYSFKTVNANQLFRTAEEVYEDELDGFFGGWLNDYPMPGL